jgi:hypothetical protein
MPLRPPAGFIRPGFDPLKNPDAPTGVSATGGNASASVAFTPPANAGGSAISQYQVVAYTGGTIVGNTAGIASPINVTGLTNGTAYTFAVWALNTYGPGPFSAMSGSVTPEVLTRGVFGGGDSNTNVMEYINIASTGNAIDFGDLISPVRGLAACASSTRGIFAGGDTGGSNASNVIQYITIATTGNAIDFGDISRAGYSQAAAFSSETRGVFAGGRTLNFGGATLNINFITIASTGNTSSFGGLAGAVTNNAGCASATRGIAAGGVFGAYTNSIEFVTIASAGNATDFGDLTVARDNLQGCSNSTRGLFAGGDNNTGGPYNTIDYITIASTGNAIDFGDLNSVSAGRYTVGACASTVRAVFTGGGGDDGKNLGFVTIASTGNAAFFGDLSANKFYYAGLSNCHGGV